MPGYVVVGTQWGDERSKQGCRLSGITHGCRCAISGEETMRVIPSLYRINTQDQNQQVVLHLLPSGVLQKASCIIGPGVVVDPFVFLEEINPAGGARFQYRHVLLSDCSHIIMPYHVRLDALIGSV